MAGPWWCDPTLRLYYLASVAPGPRQIRSSGRLRRRQIVLR